jgi:aerobic carbon-monoxide dehydrogenase large subunit
LETPSPYTSFGAKGIGEGGAVGPPAAIVSAVNDALQGMGVELCNLPLSPQRILVEIDAGRAAQRKERPCAQSSTS